jgi:predicted ArsR family transcriptional regulator
VANALTSTRLKIARLLQREGEATVESLATWIGLASATVRRHLDILQRDGLVAFEEVRRGTGRPEHSFRLSELGHEALPKAYDRLLSLLLREISLLERGALDQKGGVEILRSLFKGMARTLAASYPVPHGGSIEDRLSALLNALEDVGYSPEMRRGEGYIVVLVHNCPFRSVAREIDGACLFDQEFMSTMLGTPVERTHSIARGETSCCYRVEDRYGLPTGPR